ncbi:phosphatase 2c [Culex quinquefasciatus]|uniref:Phosphatase 2c n=1 Tax=Culex quinquefasciatus TaxID=7176 RepID=B0WSK6_CULQU|nr:phosphatase 2c [Culex quinquefasciatus]|eukprot:XP_001852905.1 phosphatase 2c [Culex quinquefasciatus]
MVCSLRNGNSFWKMDQEIRRQVRRVPFDGIKMYLTLAGGPPGVFLLQTALAIHQAYNPLKLSIIVIGHINTICDRLMDNAELNKILPDNSEVTNIPRHSVKAIKNTRRKMEDRHICIRDFHGMFGVKDSEPTSFYGVFDGHGGQDAAIYTSAHLCYNIAKSSKYPHNIEAAMREAFLKTDDAFIDKSDKHAMYSGTTAVVFIYRANEKKLFAGWVGDSQALLAAEGKVCQIVSPHTPSVESERIRIEKMGGVIMNWDGSYRVNGQLAISRAIGDASHKPFISSEPDISSICLDGEEDFLIIASDGLWEGLSEDSIAILVYREIVKNPALLRHHPAPRPPNQVRPPRASSSRPPAACLPPSVDFRARARAVLNLQKIVLARRVKVGFARTNDGERQQTRQNVLNGLLG